jgi:tape measure domain-containing protein
MASGRQVEYSLKLNSNAASVLTADAAAANKFDSSMWQVQKTLASFGLGLGAHFLIDAAKDWTQAAADYEQAMLRIKNASKTEEIGLFNEGFLNKQVDNFKLRLQETADAYGSFLFKIKNAGLSNDVQNKLFENLNIVGKVSGIAQEQMDATVRNIGILLGEGVLEARHLRQLSYVHPQLVPFLAEALGLKSGQVDAFDSILHGETTDETMMQKLSLLISSGKLTKLALPSSVIIDAVQRYADSIAGKLPETLNTVNSHLNDLSNTWLRFKNAMVLDQKPELLELFKYLEDGIRWLSEHEEGIIKTGKAIFELVKLYAE